MNTENQNEQQKKAVIYCRVSTKEQVDEGNSLTTQERICREYALKQGFEVVTLFIEKGESAKTTDRTELQHLLKYCAIKKNAVSGVIVYKIDRLSRSTADYHEIRLLLKRYGISIYSTTEFFEDTPAGRFMESIIANVAQFDNDVRTERSIGGMRDASREGRYVWMAPVGYMNTKVDGKSTIAQDEKAEIILRTFKEIAKNTYPVEEVRKMMSHEGLCNKQGKPIVRSYFYTLLKNELYCGWINKFGERHKGLFTPIVSEDLFNQVQMVLKHRSRKNIQYVVNHPEFPLRRFISNPQTGKSLTGGWSKGCAKKYPYYRFLEPSQSFPRDALETAYMAFMDGFALQDEHYPAFKELLHKYLGIGVADRQIDTTKIKARIEALKVKQKTLVEKNISGVISDTILKDQLHYLELELINLNSQLLQEPNFPVNIDELINISKAYLKNPSKIWEIANLENKIRLQQFNFPKGMTYDGKIFRTQEICRLFKVKSFFLPDLSSLVPSRENILNKVDITKSHRCLKNQAQNNSSIDPFWQEVVKEMVEIDEIVRSVIDRGG